MGTGTMLLRCCGLLYLLKCASASTFPDILKYFPETGGDASKVTWAHAVNNRKLLEESLNNDVMMLEADVSLGHVFTKESQPPIPIMAHPPAVKSDISLEDWLDEVLSSKKKKGIKLDFKNIAIVEKSLQLLKKNSDKITCPLWLNADIFPGPTNATATPVDADEFLKLCFLTFPDAVLSIGWTTRVDELPENRRYTWPLVLKMDQTLRNHRVRGGVTYPVRAAFVGQSIQQLRWLKDVTPRSTLTVWSAQLDDVDVNHLLLVRSSFPRNAVFYDLPGDLNSDFRKMKNVEMRSLEPGQEPISPLNWVFEEKECGQPGTQAIIFVGGCLAMYMDRFQGNVVNPVTVKGVVEFVSSEGGSLAHEDGMAFGLRSYPWVWIQIYSNGSINHPTNGYRQIVNALPGGKCYRFEITDSGGKQPVKLNFWADPCLPLQDRSSSPTAKYMVSIPASMDHTIQIAFSSVGKGIKAIHSLQIFGPDRNGGSVQHKCPSWITLLAILTVLYKFSLF